MITITELIDMFVADVCAGKNNETGQAYKTKLRIFAKFLDGREITGQEINAFRIDMLTRPKRRGTKTVEGGLSIFTVRTVLTTVRHFCKWAYQNEFFEKDIAPTIKIPKQPQSLPKAITKDTAAALLEAAQIHGQEWERARNIALLYWLRDTGGRVSGLLNATMKSLDLVQGFIETDEKGKTVTEYFNPPTIQALKVWLSYRANFSPKSDHVFISYQTKERLTRSGIYNILRTLANEAGLSDERRNPHSYRHAFARDFLQNGGELTKLAGILNHTSIWVTSTYYVRWNNKELQRAHSQSSPVK